MAGLCRRAVSRACRAGWVADTLVWILTPQYSNAMDMAANVIGGFGEIPISLWLLVVGVTNRRNSTSRL